MRQSWQMSEPTYREYAEHWIARFFQPVDSLRLSLDLFLPKIHLLFRVKIEYHSLFHDVNVLLSLRYISIFV